MKLYFLLILFAAFSSFASAQEDTLAYQVQRKKVNQLLDNRNAKFGQYDQSLVQRTGIFGLKTKKDMQHSIDIMTEIVKTDNAIFRELKTLLDYKDLEKSQVKDQFTETESRVINFMTTITKLQQKNESLSAELEKAKKQNTLLVGLLGVFVLAVSGIFIYLRRTKKSTFN